MKELSLNNSRLDSRYDIQRILGRGSYSEIYVARDILASPQSIHPLVVIKALNVFMQNDLDSDLERTLVENFQNEAIALDRVRHPNIISRLGHGTARDIQGTIFHYLVLEYLPGGDLANFCRQQKLQIRQALDYIEQVCAGLAHAHRSGIIHRDIKPQNLLVTEDKKTVKIADFGVARVSQSDSPITRVGTNLYAPPEHNPMLAEDTGSLTYSKLTPAADIYSLAKTVYVLITCDVPRAFAGKPISELPHITGSEPYAQEFLKVLQKATQSDPLKRHQSVEEFWEDLSRIQFTLPENQYVTSRQISLPKIPQAHISEGYTPLSPLKPHFNISKDYEIKKSQTGYKSPTPVLKIDINSSSQFTNNDFQNPNLRKTNEKKPVTANEKSDIITAPRSNTFFRKLAIFIILLLFFGGSLYATYNYLLGTKFLPSISNPFSKKEAVTLTDVNFRSEPNSRSDENIIGIVTKDSRLSIIRANENWYEVDIIKQGREAENAVSSGRGWVYGKNIQISE